MKSKIRAGNFNGNENTSTLAEPQRWSEYDTDSATSATACRRNRFTASAIDSRLCQTHTQHNIRGLKEHFKCVRGLGSLKRSSCERQNETKKNGNKTVEGGRQGNKLKRLVVFKRKHVCCEVDGATKEVDGTHA